MDFCSLFSGSSGNSLFIKNNNFRILCDAGKNGKRIEEALRQIDEDAAKLNAIIITHEHIDHIAAAGVLSRRYNIPIYANLDTWEAMLAQQKIGKIKPENQRVFETLNPFSFDELQIQPFNTSHDAACSVGFRIDDGKNSIGIATDTGIVTDGMQKNLLGCKLVVLESNHDTGMLETGNYPYYLKQRIKGVWGHLSNDRAGEFSVDLVKNGTEKLILAHLSHENNMPFLAEQATTNILNSHNIKTGVDLALEVAKRDLPSTLHRI